MKSCLQAGPNNKKCVRSWDKKIFNLPRKFSKMACMRGTIKGFTMRASCAPYMSRPVPSHIKRALRRWF